MRVVIQRVSKANVTWDREKSHIGHGMVILLGIETEDNSDDLEWLVKKIISLRIFADANGAMNLSVLDVGGEIMVVSQFTLHASTRKGNRPSFIKAARPEVAIPLYKSFISALGEATGTKVATGEFGAFMNVELINDGPVTIVIDSKLRE